MITRGSLRKLLQAGRRPNRPLGELARQDPVVAYADEPLRVVVYRMAETGLTRFPVVERSDARRLAGMISLDDLLRARARTLERRAPPRARAAHPAAVRSAANRVKASRHRRSRQFPARDSMPLGTGYSEALKNRLADETGGDVRDKAPAPHAGAAHGSRCGAGCRRLCLGAHSDSTASPSAVTCERRVRLSTGRSQRFIYSLLPRAAPIGAGAQRGAPRTSGSASYRIRQPEN